MNNLLNNIKITNLYKGDTATAATEITLTAYHVDMAGWGGCLLLATVADVSGGISTGGFELIPYHSSSTASTNFSALGSTAIAGVTATLSTAKIGMMVAVDVVKPLKRYLSCVLSKDGAAKSLCGQVMAIQYSPKVSAITQSTAEFIEAISCISPTT